MQDMTRSEVADRANVKPSAVRYYEERGLIPEPPRSSTGYRLYDASYVDRLRFIQRAQELGFTLEEINDLLALRVDEEATCQDVRARAKAKLKDVETKIQDLRRIRNALARLSDACAGGSGPTSACPILDAMTDEDALDDALF